MDVGDQVEIGPAIAGGKAGPARVRVKAVPADHAGTRYPLAADSPALGYVVTGGLSAYFAGDTGLYDGMQDLAPIDVAVLPVGGWGPRLPSDHLNPLSAAKALELLRALRPASRCTGAPSTRRGCRPSSTPSGQSGRTFSPATAAQLTPEVDVRIPAAGRVDGVRAGAQRREAARE